jgi:TrmH family RNA methyltransferase
MPWARNWRWKSTTKKPDAVAAKPEHQWDGHQSLRRGSVMNLLEPSKVQLKLWMTLQQAKVRKREKLFLVEGAKVVKDLLQSAWKARDLLILSGKEDHFADVASAVSGEIDVYRLNEKEWQRLSQDSSPEGIMAVASVPEMPSGDDSQVMRNDRLLLLHEINNPNNLGALLRTADWFGFKTVLFSAGSVDFTHPKVVRTAMGSLFHLTLIAGVDFAAILPGFKASFRLVSSDVGNGVTPHPCIGRTALLMGSESHGLPQHLLDLTDERWRIPGAGDAQSLSLPQAAAIMMYACTSK